MRFFNSVLLLVVFTAPLSAQEQKDAKSAVKRKAIFTIGKDTTIVDGPLDKDGYIDYAAALNKKLSQGVTPENNAVVLLWKAHGPHPERAKMPAAFFQWLGIEPLPEKGDYFISLRRYLQDELKIDVSKDEKFFDVEAQIGRRPWTAKEHPHIASWLKANEKPLALIVEASKRSEYFSPLVPGQFNGRPAGLIGALLPGVQLTRGFAQALTARAMLRTAHGEHDSAWQDLLACDRLGRLVGRGPTLIEGLVGIAIDKIANQADLAYLDRAKPSAKQIDRCLADLKNLPPIPPMADKVDLGERFMFLDVVMMLDRQGPQYLNNLAVFEGPFSDIIPSASLNGLIEIIVGKVDWDPALKSGNAWYDRMVKAMRSPDRQIRSRELGKINEELKALKAKTNEWTNLLWLLAGGKEGAKGKGKVIGDMLACLVVPAVNKVQDAEDRSRQNQTNLQLAFVLARYQRDLGRFPEKLDALVPKYLEKVPQDMFSGQPLIYRSMANGYLLYSVGINGKDEQGQGYGDMPRGDDLAVRMPLP